MLTSCALEQPELDTTAQSLSIDVGPNVRVSDDSTMAAQDQPTVAHVRSQPGHLLIAAHSYPPAATTPIDGVAAFWRSTDGGRTFPIRGVVPGLDRGNGGTFQGASDFSLACGSSGDCYLASFVYDLAIGRTGIAVSRSSDGGATWQPPVMVIDETMPGRFHQRCTIAIDDGPGPRRGSIYVSWIRVQSTPQGFVVPIYFAASHDRGATFSTPRAISNPADIQTDKPATAVDRAGRVYVVYENYLLEDPVNNRHVVQVSTDGGATFGAAKLVSLTWDAFGALPPARFRMNSFPQVAIDPIGDALLVAWTDMRNGGPDILVTRSIDRGTTWSAPRRVNDTPLGAQIQHALPALACGPLGVCGVSYYSGRGLTPPLLEMYFAPIVAGIPGPDVRVSTAPTDPGTQFNGRFIGEYTSLVIDFTSAHPVWTDTRVALPDPQQDIFTARITADL